MGLLSIVVVYVLRASASSLGPRLPGILAGHTLREQVCDLSSEAALPSRGSGLESDHVLAEKNRRLIRWK